MTTRHSSEPIGLSCMIIPERLNYLYLCQVQIINQLFQILMESNSLGDKIRSKKVELIESYQAKREIYKCQIEDMKKKSQEIDWQINAELQKIRKYTGELKQKAIQYMKECKDSLNNDKSRQVIDIKDLAAYLKSEKELLKILSEKQEKAASSEIDIHVLLAKSKYEKTLRYLKKKQLQQEIKYLETNVIVKNNLIYNTAVAPTISHAQEKEINQKLQNGISQLERIIQLSISCSQIADESDKIVKLNRQENRLKECQGMLMSQYQKLGKLLKYFEGQNHSVLGKLPLPIYEAGIATKSVHLSGRKKEQKVSEAQLDEVLGFCLPQNKTKCTVSHTFNDWQQEIELLRKKYRKIEKLM